MNYTPGPVADTENRLGSSSCGAYDCGKGERGSIRKVNYITAIVPAAMVSMNSFSHHRAGALAFLHLIRLLSFKKVPKEEEVRTSLNKSLTEW